MRDGHLHRQRHGVKHRDGHRHGHLRSRRRAWRILLLVLHHQRVGCMESASTRTGMAGISVCRNGTRSRGRSTSALTVSVIMAGLIGSRRHVGRVRDEGALFHRSS